MASARRRMTKEQIHEFQQAFDLFDADGSGTISSRELITAMQSFNLKPKESEINAMVKVGFDDYMTQQV